MIRIGFIDHYIDEWHANNYPLWIADPRHGGQCRVALAWAETERPGGMTTAEWCEKFGVEQARSQEELVEKSDAIAVLSPDNPERHEALAALALKSGKPVYVDKTFSLETDAANRMFDLAARHGTPMYSTSALRYAGELGWLAENGIGQREVEFASAVGPGTFETYAIHQIEMIVAAMGPGARRAIALGAKNAPVVHYEFDGGRSCMVNLMPWAGFSLTLQSTDGAGMARRIESDFWSGFIGALLLFFKTGKPPVPREETCAAVVMVEAGIRALRQPGQWQTLNQ